MKTNHFISYMDMRPSALLSHSWKSLFVLLVFVLGLNQKSLAVVKTQEWQESHRGYSVEQIPGTGVAGAVAEYVAAGTMYTNGPGRRAGWHFMRLDEFGNVLASRIAYSNATDEEFRVVDITVESATKFWITTEARHLVSAAQYDYIYVAGVDQNGNDLTVNPAIHITPTAAVGSHRNLYPTHSLFMGGELYICGYAAEHTSYPNYPAYYSDKLGFMLKCDVNATPVNVNFYVWNTNNSLIPIGDFDMPLRISPSLVSPGFQAGFPLLVTGSGNMYGSGYISGVLAMRFDQNLGLTGYNLFLPTAWAFSPDPMRLHGVYGMDIRGPLYPDEHEGEGGYAILLNSFDDIAPYNRTWGVLRIQRDFTPYDPVNNHSFVGLTGTKSWGTQFAEVFYADKSITNSVTVIGQQNELYDREEGCDQLDVPNLAPRHYPNNINPFVTQLNVGGAGLWTNATGYGPTYNMANFFFHRVHLSSKGTQANNMSYLSGSMPNGYMEDMTRLYTFASVSQYYFGSTSATAPTFPAIVAPVGELNAPPGNNPFLLTKFIQTTTWGESSCDNVYNDCPQLFTSTTYASGEFESAYYEGFVTADAYLYFTLFNNYTIPNNVDCATGYYKPASVSNVNVENKIGLYPNPASTELNIQLPKDLQTGDKLSFRILDIAGKEVYRTQDQLHVKLPSLAPGMYIATVEYNGAKHSEKITIE